MSTNLNLSLVEAIQVKVHDSFGGAKSYINNIYLYKTFPDVDISTLNYDMQNMTGTHHENPRDINEERLAMDKSVIHKKSFMNEELSESDLSINFNMKDIGKKANSKDASNYTYNKTSYLPSECDYNQNNKGIRGETNSRQKTENTLDKLKQALVRSRNSSQNHKGDTKNSDISNEVNSNNLKSRMGTTSYSHQNNTQAKNKSGYSKVGKVTNFSNLEYEDLVDDYLEEASISKPNNKSIEKRITSQQSKEPKQTKYEHESQKDSHSNSNNNYENKGRDQPKPPEIRVFEEHQYNNPYHILENQIQEMQSEVKNLDGVIDFNSKDIRVNNFHTGRNLEHKVIKRPEYTSNALTPDRYFNKDKVQHSSFNTLNPYHSNSQLNKTFSNPKGQAYDDLILKGFDPDLLKEVFKVPDESTFILTDIVSHQQAKKPANKLAESKYLYQSAKINLQDSFTNQQNSGNLVHTSVITSDTNKPSLPNPTEKSKDLSSDAKCDYCEEMKSKIFEMQQAISKLVQSVDDLKLELEDLRVSNSAAKNSENEVIANIQSQVLANVQEECKNIAYNELQILRNYFEEVFASTYNNARQQEEQIINSAEVQSERRQEFNTQNRENYKEDIRALITEAIKANMKDLFRFGHQPKNSDTNKSRSKPKVNDNQRPKGNGNRYREVQNSKYLNNLTL